MIVDLSHDGGIQIYCPSRNQAGVFATGEIRQNVNFAAFWSVFLTKIKVDPESC